MSKDIKNITEDIMNQIEQGKIKMKPKWYFIIGSIITFIGLVSSLIVSTFLFGLIRFSLRTHGPMGEYRLDQIISNFPWLTIIFAIVGLVLGIWLIRQYDFSYKTKPWLIITGFVFAVIVAGWTIDIIGVNDNLLKKGTMKGIMHNYYQENNIQPGMGWRK
jgi:magnesium-transporting ATPase (P-type)